MGGAVKSLGGFLGLGGEGEGFSPASGNQALDDMLKRRDVYTSPRAQQDLRDYESGKTDITQALNQAANMPPQWQAEFMNQLAAGPITGQKFATEQVQKNPILKTLFGQGGAMERANTEEQDLAGRGFQLKPEDHEAYGQASGNIARLFGQQENDVSSQLAQRGLLSAGSGAAGQSYTGLMGNKYEQLARAQTDIANKRMENNMQRLNSTRGYLSQLGGQAQSAINSQYATQRAGADAQNALLSDAARLQIGNNAEANGANQANKSMMMASAPKNFMDFAAAGAGQGIQSGLGGSSGSSGKIGGKEYSSQGTGVAGLFG